MARTRVKICGITRPEDVVAAAELGADAVGLNFVGGPRRVTRDQAHAIYWTHGEGTELGDANHWISANLDVVALCAIDGQQFPKSTIWDEVSTTSGFTPDIYQIYGHGYEAIASSPLLKGKWWMVGHVNDRSSILRVAVAAGMLPDLPAAILFDTASANSAGGTGQSFNWHWIAEARAAGELDGLPPIILAGGLTPDNVAEAIRIARPYAVDVASGVEVAGKPGIKDPIKMRDFIQAAQGA